jgi:hypothetical protein
MTVVRHLRRRDGARRSRSRSSSTRRGELLVVTGATAAQAGLGATVVSLSGRRLRRDGGVVVVVLRRGGRADARHPERLRGPRQARPRRLHLPAGADRGRDRRGLGRHLLIDAPHEPLHGVGSAVVLCGPALYLLGESLFRRRMTSSANVKRLAVAAALVLLVPVGDEISAVALSAIVAALPALLAVWERLPARAPRSA